MKRVCRPSDREVNWRFPVQRQSRHVQVKEPYGNLNWLLAARGVQCPLSVPF